MSTETAAAALAAGLEQGAPKPNHPLSVLFATPTLGQPADEHMESLIATLGLLGRHGIPCDLLKAKNKTFMGVARDQLATAWLADRRLGQFENLFFIDDDVGWPSEKVLEFLAAPEPILAGVPPFKRETLRGRLDAIVIKFREINDLVSEDFVSEVRDALDNAMEFPWNPHKPHGPRGGTTRNDRGMFAAEMVPMGFCRIKRSAMIQIARNCPQYKDDGTGLLGDNVTISMFQDGPDAEGIHRGEDYAFCGLARHFGVEIWVDPDIEFTHRGSHVFRGRLADTL